MTAPQDTVAPIAGARKLLVVMSDLLFRSKIDGHAIDHSMHSAAARHAFGVPLPCVGAGQTIGCPSQRAMRKRR